MLAPPRAPDPGTVRPLVLTGDRPRRRRIPRRRRVRRIGLFVAAMLIVPALVSYATTMTQPSDSAFGVRTVEWLRDHGARGIVNKVESIYYSLNAPSKGGPPLRALPNQPGVAAVGALAKPQGPAYYKPHRIRPLIHPALPGEGVWRSTFANAGPHPPVMVTSFRSDPSYPQMVAGVAWIDQHQTTTWLYPGIQEPAVSMPSRGPEEVPPALRPRLVATFNSGFKLADSGGGFASGGHAYAPLKPGLATILRYRSGRIDIRAWGGGSQPGPNIIFARQNLPLIVEHGRPNPNLSDGPEWGATLGNAIQVWRSALGIDGHGNLIYAAADNQTVGSLANIMIRAGAVRAMELDINYYWTSFITYKHRDARDPANLLSSMDRSPYRYLTPDDRDFFAVYLK